MNTKTNNKGDPSKSPSWWIRLWNKLQEGGVHNWLMVAATITIAWSTGKQWSATKGQLEVMQRQLGEMQASRSPWLGIEDNSISVSQAPNFFWGIPPKTVEFPTITVEASYYLKNFGTSPAFHAADMLIAIEHQRDQSVPPTDEIDTACVFSEMKSTQAGTANPGAGQMILPGARIGVSRRTNLQLPSRHTQLQNIWFFVCVTYQDSQKNMHYSRYWYLSSPIGGPAIPVPGHPEWTYTAITGANLWGAEAK